MPMHQVHGGQGTFHVEYPGGGEDTILIQGDILTYLGDTYEWSEEEKCWYRYEDGFRYSIYLYGEDEWAEEGFFGYIPLDGSPPRTGNYHA